MQSWAEDADPDLVQEAAEPEEPGEPGEPEAGAEAADEEVLAAAVERAVADMLAREQGEADFGAEVEGPARARQKPGSTPALKLSAKRPKVECKTP